MSLTYQLFPHKYHKEKHRSYNDASEEVDLEVNTEKTKFMLMSRHQNSERNHNKKTDNRSFTTFLKLRYLGMTATYQIL
jgi:hypothetical protein